MMNILKSAGDKAFRTGLIIGISSTVNSGMKNGLYFGAVAGTCAAAGSMLVNLANCTKNENVEKIVSAVAVGAGIEMFH